MTNWKQDAPYIPQTSIVIFLMAAVQGHNIPPFVSIFVVTVSDILLPLAVSSHLILLLI